jgi:hypothetical protein
MNKIMKRNVLLVVIAAVVSMNIFACAGGNTNCPSRLTVQEDIKQSLNGWQKYSAHESHPLVNVFFSEGEPEKQVILPPTGKGKVKGAFVSEWKLPKSAKGYWVSCVYDDTSVTLARKMPDDVTYCEANYEKDSTRSVVKQWSCGNGAKPKQVAKGR